MGTRHNLEANDRYMIGVHHWAFFIIESDIESLYESARKYVNVTITILDCKLESFEGH